MSNKIISLGSYNPRGFCNGRIIEKDGISPALCLLKGAEHAITINDNGLTLEKKKEKVYEYVKLRNEGKLMDYDKKNLRIRKLTPRETWRLMGFDDADFEKARKINSDARLYQQAGNSIVVNCLEAIFKKLLF